MPIRRPDRPLDKPGSEFYAITSAVAATAVPAHLDYLVRVSRGAGGRPRTHLPYPSLALLVGLICLVWEQRPLTLSNLLRLFWEVLTEEQLALVGLSEVVTAERRALYAGRRGDRREYNRLHRDFDAMVSVFDPSPFAGHRAQHRRERLTVKERKAILSGLTVEDQAALLKKERRLDWVLNTLLGAFVGERPLGYEGHHVGDATIVEASAAISNTGFAQDKLRYGSDLDATWWNPTKEARDTDRPSPVERHGRVGKAKRGANKPLGGSSTASARRRGPVWGFAIHLVQRTHKVYENEVAKVATGIAITRACGGDVKAALRAVRGHINNGQGPRPGTVAESIWDNGYTNLDEFAAGLLPLRYRVVRDYGKSINPLRPRGASGVLIWQGAELCPGAIHAVEGVEGWVRWPGYDADPMKIRAHDQRMEGILAFRLVSNGTIRHEPLQPDTAAKRQRAQRPYGPYVASRGCPARGGTCGCPLVPGSTDLGLPEVPKSKAPVPYRKARVDQDGTLHPEQGFSICGEKSFTDVRYTDSEFKALNPWPYVVGTAVHADRYGGARSRNEQYHAELEAPESGNLRPEVFDLHGLARVGLLVTASAIVTNIRLLRAFDRAVEDNGGRAPDEDRRSQREAHRARTRQHQQRHDARVSIAEHMRQNTPKRPLWGDRRRGPRL